VVAGVVTVAAAAPALAAERSASAVGQASARVIKPLRSRILQILDFGALKATGSSRGRVDVVPGQQSAVYSGSAQPACERAVACNRPHPALIAIQGESDRGYHVTLPQEVVAKSDDGANNAIVISDLKFFSHAAGLRSAAGVLDAQGRDLLELGGSIDIPENSGASHYRADISVTVDYD